MRRFRICDTDVKFLEKLAAALHQIFDPCTVEYMYGPSALEVSLRSDPGGADVLITEIELRDENAIDIIARNLRESSPLQIIYMTSKIEYCLEVYETPHCGFWVKPIPRNRLKKDIDRALKSLERSKETGVLIQKNGSVHIVRAQSLLYAESHGRVLRIITDDEELESYEKITDFIF